MSSSNFQPRRSLSYHISLDLRRKEDSENIGVEGSISNDTRVTALYVHQCDVIKFLTSPQPIVSHIIKFASKKKIQNYMGCGVIDMSTSPKPIVSHIVRTASKKGFQKHRV